MFVKLILVAVPLALLKAADAFFFIFHTALVVFNTFGWASKRLRPFNLLTLGLTAFSWFFLGIWYGWGYCWFTDWHWEIRQALGYHDETNSYIGLLVGKLTGAQFPEPLINMVTIVVFAVSIVISMTLNIRDYKKSRLAKKSGN